MYFTSQMGWCQFDDSEMEWSEFDASDVVGVPDGDAAAQQGLCVGRPVVLTQPHIRVVGRLETLVYQVLKPPTTVPHTSTTHSSS